MQWDVRVNLERRQVGKGWASQEAKLRHVSGVVRLVAQEPKEKSVLKPDQSRWIKYKKQRVCVCDRPATSERRVKSHWSVGSITIPFSVAVPIGDRHLPIDHFRKVSRPSLCCATAGHQS